MLCFCLCSPISLEACFSNCSLERLAWSHSRAELNIRENQFRFTIVLFLVLCYLLTQWPLRVGFRLPESYKKAMTNQELHGLNQTWIKWPSTFGSQSSNALLDYTQRNQKTNLSTGHVWSNFNPKGLVRQSSLFLGREVLPKCCNLSMCSRPRKRQEKTSDIVLTYIYIYNWQARMCTTANQPAPGLVFSQLF